VASYFQLTFFFVLSQKEANDVQTMILNISKMFVVWHVWRSGAGLAVWDVAVLLIGKIFGNGAGPNSVFQMPFECRGCKLDTENLLGMKMKAIKLETIEISPS
jgi:hypothetical protein